MSAWGEPREDTHEKDAARSDRAGFVARARPRPDDGRDHDGKNTDNVLTASMGLDRKSYSPLKQINKSNIKRLVPVWSTSLMNDCGRALGARPSTTA